MYHIKFNDGAVKELKLEDNIPFIDDHAITWSSQLISKDRFNILANGKSYDAIVESINRAKKIISIRVNNNLYEMSLQEPIDLLLEKMGLDISKMQKVEPIKSPMPGLILKVMVEEGQSIKKGDPVLVLEAMKMENVFKAPADAVIKAIKVSEKQAVEKGEVLIELA